VSAKNTWTSVRSKIFVAGNASEKEYGRIGVRLETVREVFFAVVCDEGQLAVPTTVIVFKTIAPTNIQAQRNNAAISRRALT